MPFPYAVSFNVRQLARLCTGTESRDRPKISSWPWAIFASHPAKSLTTPRPQRNGGPWCLLCFDSPPSGNVGRNHFRCESHSSPMPGLSHETVPESDPFSEQVFESQVTIA